LAKLYRSIQQWDHWLRESLGESLLAAEKAALSRLLSERYGKHALLIGVPKQYTVLKGTLMPNAVVLGPLINKHKIIKYIESEFYELPILEGSVDIVLLPHTLEYIDNPRRLLSEACRIVKPEGWLVVMGFNPWSLWGFRKWWLKNKSIPWSGAFIEMSIIKKWLTIADFEPIKQEKIFFRPPFKDRSIFRKLTFLEWVGKKCFSLFGGVYIVIAKPKIIPLTTIRLRWQQKLSTNVPAHIPGPTMRDIS
jgi:SAM-dependent methyltransferase